MVEAKMNSLNDAKYSVKDGLENNAEGGNINIAKYGLKSSVNIEKERETCAQDDSKNAEKRRWKMCWYGSMNSFAMVDDNNYLAMLLLIY